MTQIFLFPRMTGADHLEIDDLAPGEWMPTSRADGARGAIIRCPTCRRTSSLDHAIDDDGTVSPSIVCPTSVLEPVTGRQIPGCAFHVHGRLLDWNSASVVVR